MKPIRIGQLGMGHEHAAGKMEAVRGLPEYYELVGVVDDRESQAARFIGEDLSPYQGIPRLSESELFATPGLEAVLVETPNTDLVPTALRCVDQNLAMHLDKPGGEDLALFKKLLSGCEKKKLPLQLGYMFRGNPAFQFCLQAVRKNWLGKIFEFQGSMSHDYGGVDYQRYLGAFKGGILFNLGGHLIDFAVALLGRPEQVTPFLKSTEGLSFLCLNQGLAILEYPHATATIRACSQEVGGLNHRRLKICGEWGTLELCPLERFDGKPIHLDMTLSRGNETYPSGFHRIEFKPQQNRYREQLIELAMVVRGEKSPDYSYEHEDLVQEVLLAASGYITWKPS